MTRYSNKGIEAIRELYKRCIRAQHLPLPPSLLDDPAFQRYLESLAIYSK